VRRRVTGTGMHRMAQRSQVQVQVRLGSHLSSAVKRDGGSIPAARPLLAPSSWRY
jgi:hypothetical protein